MFKIVTDKEKSLRQRSVDVELPLSNERTDLLLSMIEYLKLSQNEEYAAKHHIKAGVGLAAPQIGINEKMIAIYYEGENGIIQYGLVNPKITSNSVRKSYLKGGEGCLSVKEDHEGYVIRDYKIVVQAFDIIQNKNIEIVARGYDAIVLQHEIDHLYGVLYYDRINKTNPFQEIENAYII